jgi:beta-alanine degradation protein BauB
MLSMAMVCLLAGVVSAQDVVKVAPPGVVKVEAENDQVRVLRFTEPGGTKLPMHSHPAYVAVDLSGGESHYTFPDGKTSHQKSKPGETAFSKGITHAADNVSKTTANEIMVELKTKPAGINAPADSDMVKVSEGHAKTEIDNEYARVIRVKVGPKGKLAMHSHQDNIVVYVTGGKMKVTGPDGKSQENTIEPGSIRVSGPTKHSNENLGDKPFEAIVIELKTATK